MSDPKLTLHIVEVDEASKSITVQAELGSPNDPKYSNPADVRIVNTSPWNKAEGGWKWRTFGDELQLRNLAELPHVPVDLLRSEAVHLLRALEAALEVPRTREYRLSVWQRLSFWWSRKVWNRKHHLELDAARADLLKRELQLMTRSSGIDPRAR